MTLSLKRAPKNGQEAVVCKDTSDSRKKKRKKSASLLPNFLVLSNLNQPFATSVQSRSERPRGKKRTHKNVPGNGSCCFVRQKRKIEPDENFAFPWRHHGRGIFPKNLGSLSPSRYKKGSFILNFWSTRFENFLRYFSETHIIKSYLLSVKFINIAQTNLPF